MSGLIIHGSDLFNYDQKACSHLLLPLKDKVVSKVEYDELVVYRTPHDSSQPESERDLEEDNKFTVHRFSRDQATGAVLLDLAFRQGHAVDRHGEFTLSTELDPLHGLQGRVRRIICFRRPTSYEGSRDAISMTAADLAALDLHPATLQYATRRTTESRFWSADRSKLSLILCFSDVPTTPCDYLSMTYDVATRSATMLIRQSWEPRRHKLDDLHEYDYRLESCRAHWAHPFIMPVVLLQVQFMRCEEAVSDNTDSVRGLEAEIGSFAGFQNFEPPPRRFQSNPVNGKGGRDSWGPSAMTNLMQKAHGVLRHSINLLDTL